MEAISWTSPRARTRTHAPSQWQWLLSVGLILFFTLAVAITNGEVMIKSGKSGPRHGGRLPQISAPEFKVDSSEGLGPCVLIAINATIAIEPIRTANKKYLVEIPHRAEAKGKCGNGDDAQIIIQWDTFRLGWHFQKIRMSDAWKVNSIEFNYNKSEKVFGGDLEMAGTPTEDTKVRTPEPFVLWLTPLGSSYSCAMQQSLLLMDEKKERRVTINIRRIEVQPFAKMTRRQYGEPFMCPEEAGRRDETVPLAVGSLLAIATLCTIGGYAGHRYMKVKKVDYDTMEYDTMGGE